MIGPLPGRQAVPGLLQGLDGSGIGRGGLQFFNQRKPLGELLRRQASAGGGVEVLVAIVDVEGLEVARALERRVLVNRIEKPVTVPGQGRDQARPGARGDPVCASLLQQDRSCLRMRGRNLGQHLEGHGFGG